MAKVITQETFDDVVKENILEFEMNPAEAKDETIKQFEAQGINLANIIKDLTLNEKSGEPILKESIDILKTHASGAEVLNDNELINNLHILELECDKTVPHRVLAANIGGLKVLLLIIIKNLSQDGTKTEILKACLSTANALINKQPDIFDDETLSICIKLLDSQTDLNIICTVLTLISKACVMHEINRQNIMNANVMNHLKPLIRSDEPGVIKDVCAVFRYLVLDDDIRVEFGKAHEHARAIASEVLTDLTSLLMKFKNNQNLLCDLILTLASLTVRNEYCVMVEEAGGLKFILDAMEEHVESIKVSKESLKLLRSLAGNDTVKCHIIQQGAAPLINNVLNKHKSNELFAKFALLCISTLSLRSVENSKELYEAGIAETIVETIRLHENNKSILRNGAWAIRNMVSRSRYQCETFINHGVEDILTAALTAHPSIENDIKSALRDLGCKITLKEEWVHTSAVKIEN